MSDPKFKPYVPPEQTMAEFTFKAVLTGIFLAMILGAANAYLGLKAGMTVAATFPAAVISMAVLRPFKGTILEENLARTTGAVGEALAAGAIFTIPAFIMAGVWQEFNYLQSTALMLIGGILGVLFVIMLRKALIHDTSLPYPESVACAEIVKAGQGGATGAGYVFSMIGVAGLIEFLKNPSGLQIINDRLKTFIDLGTSKVRYLIEGKEVAVESFKGGTLIEAPLASPALTGVGYIIGPRLASITFSGGVFGWLFLMPLVLFLNGESLSAMVAQGLSWADIAKAAYSATIKPVAVGAMLVGAFYTLYNMRQNLISGISRGFADIKAARAGEMEEIRTEKDLRFSSVLLSIFAIVILMVFLYSFFTKSFGAGLVSALVMAVAGFVFAAVAGYLVGIIGSSSNPISGLTLTTLLIAAVLMVLLGQSGTSGIIAVLAVASVVCVVAGVAGDMMQDWKVGHILGGTPWRMQIGGMIGVTAAALVLVFPLMWLHSGTPGGIGGENLPAPQAGLMAMMAKGIVGGEMAWPLVLAGMLFSFALILIKSPSPMLIAVGMYLPFNTTFAIFIGGVIKFMVTKMAEKRSVAESDKEKIENTGILLASGLVAGEALMGIILAVLVTANIHLPSLVATATGGLKTLTSLLSLVVFMILAYILIRIPLKALEK
jgi:putative OPT family oligopeptide transporter